MTSRVALVIPWFGKEQAGGAERQAREVALRLAERGHRVDVFTTCSRSFQAPWADNYFPSGMETDSDIKVHRFPVDLRRDERFDSVNSRLLGLAATELIPGVSPLTDGDEDVFARENINSSALNAELRRRASEFDAVLFTPYLYGTTLNGLPGLVDGSYLIPCLHDEAYAYLSVCAQVFRQAKGVLYLSEGEELLAQQLYGPAISTKGTVVGSGIELFERGAVDRHTQPSPVSGSFVLILGRRDATKNTDLAVKAFKAFRRQSAVSDLKLVLAGPGRAFYGDRDEDIYDFGLVDEVTKRTLLRDARALFQPSRNESYSRVMMESWAYKKPVVVHGACDATAIAVHRSGGGWVARTIDEWADAFRRIVTLTVEEHQQVGLLGYQYACSAADWGKVMDRYEAALGIAESRVGSPAPSRDAGIPAAIHQVLPNMAYGDAISDSARTLRDFLRARGIRSDILVQYLDERMAGEARVFEAGLIDDGDGLVYHHSVGSALTSYAKAHNGPCVLIYHNITPPRFFEPYDEEFANVLAKGLKELRLLAPTFQYAWADSKFNAAGLAEAGFSKVEYAPLIVDPSKWSEAPGADLIRALRRDEKENVLFVGRLAPNKCQHDLVEMAARLIRLNPDIRLCIIGDGEDDHPYVEFLKGRIEALGLTENVLISGQVSQPALQAFYRTADVYVSMSEHEGFGVPLIEAMWFDVPVVAFKSSAIPETLGTAAVMFTSKSDMDSVAALVNVVLTDWSVRQRILAGQRQNRSRFTTERLEPYYEQLLNQAFV